jgi:transcription elongation factor Elf1
VSEPDSEFRPCPFCGSSLVGALTEAQVRDPATNGMVPDPHAKLGVVGCGVCGAEGPSLCDTPEEMAAGWNRRATDEAAVDALREEKRRLIQESERDWQDAEASRGELEQRLADLEAAVKNLQEHAWLLQKELDKSGERKGA